MIILLTNILFADVYATYEVKALNEASLNVSTSGIVSKINTDVGNKVKKGEVLLSLNDSEEKANLEISKNEYKFLLTQYERYKKSAEVFDKNSLDKLESELKSAKDIADSLYEIISTSHIGINSINCDRKMLKRIEIIASDDVMSLRKKIDGYYDFL